MAVKIKHKIKAYNAIRRDPALVGLMEEVGHNIANRAEGMGRGSYDVVTSNHKSRAHVAVHTGDIESIIDNSRGCSHW